MLTYICIMDSGRMYENRLRKGESEFAVGQVVDAMWLQFRDSTIIGILKTLVNWYNGRALTRTYAIVG